MTIFLPAWVVAPRGAFTALDEHPMADKVTHEPLLIMFTVYVIT